MVGWSRYSRATLGVGLGGLQLGDCDGVGKEGRASQGRLPTLEGWRDEFGRAGLLTRDPNWNGGSTSNSA